MIGEPDTHATTHARQPIRSDAQARCIATVMTR